MAYKSLKEISAEVKANLKKEFPNCKFSVRTQYYAGGQSLHVALMSAPFDVYGSEQKGTQLNQYQLQDEPEKWGFICNGIYLTRKGWEVLRKMCKIACKDRWDDSDPMTDYFSTNYYFHPYVGRWNKPFVKTTA